MSDRSQLQHVRIQHTFHAVFHFGVAKHPQPGAPDASHADVEVDAVLVCERVPAAGPTRADASTSMVMFKALGSLTPLAMTSGLRPGKCAV